MTTTPEHEMEALDREWSTEPRWKGVHRDYGSDDVVNLRGSMRIEHTVARLLRDRGVAFQRPRDRHRRDAGEPGDRLHGDRPGRRRQLPPM